MEKTVRYRLDRKMLPYGCDESQCVWWEVMFSRNRDRIDDQVKGKDPRYYRIVKVTEEVIEDGES